MTYTISFKVTNEQHAMITKIARDAGLSAGQLARFAALQSANMSILESTIRAARQEIIDANRDDLRKAAEYIVKNLRK